MADIVKKPPIELIETEVAIADKVYVVPAGYILARDPEIVAQEQKDVELQKLQDEFSTMREPSIDELTEMGRMTHPYYIYKRKIEQWQ